MNTAKEWLKANGHIKEVTRGRISNENHKRLLAAVAEGVKFSDYPKGGTVVKTEAGEEKYVKPEKPTELDQYGELFYRYSLEGFQAVAEDGTIYGMREACNNCGLSLVGHKCNNPSVLGKRVEVVPRR